MVRAIGISVVLRLRVLEALAHNAAGDRTTALRALAESFALAAPEGYVRLFLDEGPDGRHAPAGARGRAPPRAARPPTAPREFLARLTDAFDRRGTWVLAPARRDGPVAPGMAAPLSAREHEVLTLMASGHPNRAIAEELFITVDTVKRHVTHVFDKLGVSNRTHAVARARARAARLSYRAGAVRIGSAALVIGVTTGPYSDDG